MTFRSKGLTRVFARSTLVAAAAATALALGASAAEAVPFPTKSTPQPRDIGRSSATMTVTVMLKSRDEAGLAKLAADLYTPGHPQFHQFLSAEQFHARFDPSAQSVATVSSYFRALGLSVRQDGNLLEVTGPARLHEKAFGVTMRDYEVAAHGKNAAYRFYGTADAPSLRSPKVAALVESVVGLDNAPRFVPNAKRLPQNLRPAATVKTAASATGNLPGFWTVNDLASYYNVTPLYDAGIHGEGKTLAIVTLASFSPADAFTYWNENGLTTDPNRIKIVDIDGGPGPICDACGSGETTLDVEQSGGVAPGAKVIVYQAPNTNHSFLHAFVKAVNDDKADSISVSWGSWEWFETFARSKAPRGNYTYLKAFNRIFLQGAVQGQSLIASAGDAGAYEGNRALPYPDFSKVISVGGPASSPWITAAGGTTVPTHLVFSNGIEVNITSEQAWGWSYLTDYCAFYGVTPEECGIWPVGGGGGVSVFHPMPAYQKNVKGIRTSEAGQSLVSGGIDYFDLPAGFAGRNMPDVSMNADPETGYVLDYTSETGEYSQTAFYGGTSFVSPQLNGIAALLAQKVGGRVGLLNAPLYSLAVKKSSYKGDMAPLRDITAGDIWFYTGGPGYDQATGVGTLNVANFAEALVSGSATVKSK